ncbi:MAG: septum formation protein Maf [Lachnospiraceae bacterium]|nr:septum formation protein Maf [Lachnospiraceae bacterium]
MNLEKTKIILASQSPRRLELMSQAGFDFEVIPSDVEEIITSAVPSEIVKELSSQKAQDVFNKLLSSMNSLPILTDDDINLMVIGADTVVANGNSILGKPHDHEEAFNMLSSLSGKTHQVYTGVSVYLYNFSSKSTKKHSFYESTDVTFYELSSSEINSYISTRDCFDKAGSYGIQGPFAIHVKGIKGDYNNVVGLPIARLYQELKNIM